MVIWLKHTPFDPEAPTVGPGLPQVRGPGRINRILAAGSWIPAARCRGRQRAAEVPAMLFEVSDDRHLPVQARGENAALDYVARPRHRLSEPEVRVDRASDEEVLALLGACWTARESTKTVGTTTQDHLRLVQWAVGLGAERLWAIEDCRHMTRGGWNVTSSLLVNRWCGSRRS